MNEIFNEILQYLKYHQLRGRIILHKNQQELEFLTRWIHGTEPSACNPPRAKNLAAEIASCTRCGNALGKKRSFGTGENGVMVILNAPRLITPEEKRMLKSEAVDLTKKMLGAIHLEAEKCYITNIIKCDPDVDVKPSSMYKNCAPFLEEEFKRISPHTVIVMGHIVPLKKFIDSSKNTKWFNIEHPITILKNVELKKGAWITLKEVKKHIESIKGAR
ncbi:MAG: hypothetical protein N2316_00340 [Spirochaetes bacterium]|nr:hypothetical protein [Spirochaetota bacterium]